ncbi:MAG: hypothetical protein K6T65_14650 [Peptococcaceae bacterium]|nr:hypothetical protein [Peptococcaceae bacterium]
MEQKHEITGRKILCPWCNMEFWELEYTGYDNCPHCNKYVGNEEGTPITVIVTIDPLTGMPWAETKEGAA